jgi:hypothetical protein
MGYGEGFEWNGLLTTSDADRLQCSRKAMSKISQIAWIAFFIGGVFCLVYSWVVLLKTSPEKPLRWRGRASLIALLLASLAAILRFRMPAFWPPDFGKQVHTAVVWTRVSVGMCALALPLGFAGRPRLIAPIVVTCCATAAFWVMSTIP